MSTVRLGRDPWRWTCPRGHHALKIRSNSHRGRPRATDTPGRFCCRTCRAAGHDPYYTADQLVDKKQRARDDDGSWPDP